MVGWDCNVVYCSGLGLYCSVLGWNCNVVGWDCTVVYCSVVGRDCTVVYCSVVGWDCTVVYCGGLLGQHFGFSELFAFVMADQDMWTFIIIKTSP